MWASSESPKQLMQLDFLNLWRLDETYFMVRNPSQLSKQAQATSHFLARQNVRTEHVKRKTACDTKAGNSVYFIRKLYVSYHFQFKVLKWRVCKCCHQLSDGIPIVCYNDKVTCR